jgi:pyruvate/2-oxoglutarate dehydrogenase complex dihydrolipoamide dehydrogenase (E3) component
VSGVDAAVVGAGSAGLTVAVGLARLGRRVALVEAGEVGGDCTNAGCIPSKALIRLAREGADPVAALAEVRRLRDALRAREDAEVSALPGLHLVRGRARLLGPGRIGVRGPDGVERRFAARHVVLATGSRPQVLAVPGLPPERVLTTRELFDLDAPPGHLVIAGAGPVGVELASALRRLGSRVTMVALDRLPLPAAPPEAGEAVARGLRARGVDLHLGATLASFDEALRTLEIRTPGGPVQVAGVDRVLMAVGRLPAVEGLGLARVGLAEGPGPIAVDGWGRTAARGVWAAGDVTGAPLLTSAAGAEGRRVARRIGLPWLPAVGRPPVVPWCVFGEPEVAHAGPLPDEVAARCHEGVLMRLRVDLAAIDRGYVDGVGEGFASVVAVRLTGRIVSATVVGPGAGEVIGQLAMAIARRIPLWRVFGLVQPYPTYAGAVGALADEFTRRTLPALPAEARAWARHRLRRAGA